MLNFVFRSIQNFILFIFCLSLAACASGGGLGDASLGEIPEHWAKYLSVGSISATLAVYDEQGELLVTQDLALNAETGELSTPQFKLPIGGNDRFIITFNYQLSAGNLIPYAYADFKWLVDEFSENVTFSDNDINYDANDADPSIAADRVAGKIPNLDLDGDQWSNWEELRDKVDPQDAKSIPIVPTVTVSGQQDGGNNTATLTVIAKDNAHVEELRLLDPLCGVSVLSDTIVSNVDGSVTRTLVVKLDLLSIRDGQSSRGLQALANDGVTAAQNASDSVAFNVSGSASQPYFAFVEPGLNEEVEDLVPFQGVACSRYDLDLNQTRFLNPEIASFTFSSQRNPQTGDYAMESDSVDTTLLPDGLVTLQVEVKDVTNKAGQGSGVFKVVNDSEIKIVSPVGRRWVFGNEQVAATLKNQSANLVVIEGNNNFTLSSSTAGGAVGTLKIGNLAENTLVPLTFKAVRSDGSEIVRKVNFSVRNKPQIKTFVPQADSVFQGWKTGVSYKIVNVDPNNIFIEGQSAALSGGQTCGTDPNLPGVVSCEGVIPVLQTKSSGVETVDVLAQRLPTADENCLNCIESQSFELKSGGVLSNDIPIGNVAIDGDDEAEAPEKLAIPVNPAGKVYQLSLVDLSDQSELDFGEKGSGASFTLNGLNPRRDYRAVLRGLSGPGGNLISEIFKDVTTGDIGLVGWWRFNSDPAGPVCPNGSAGETVCDYSGRNNHGKPMGGVEFLPPGAEFLDGAFGFDGVDDWVSVDSSSSLNFGNNSNISLEAWINNSSFPSGSSWILGKGVGGDHGNYALVMTDTLREIKFTFKKNGLPNFLPTYESKIPVNFNEWTHVVMSHTFGNGSIFKMKVNGITAAGFWQDADADPGVTGNEQPLTNSDVLTFGRRSIISQNYFSGFLGEVMIFNRVLSEPEMDQHYLRFH